MNNDRHFAIFPSDLNIVVTGRRVPLALLAHVASLSPYLEPVMDSAESVPCIHVSLPSFGHSPDPVRHSLLLTPLLCFSKSQPWPHCGQGDLRTVSWGLGFMLLPQPQGTQHS